MLRPIECIYKKLRKPSNIPCMFDVECTFFSVGIVLMMAYHMHHEIAHLLNMDATRTQTQKFIIKRRLKTKLVRHFRICFFFQLIFSAIHCFNALLRLRGYKTFFMLNSTEDEISTAHKKLKYRQMKKSLRCCIYHANKC